MKSATLRVLTAAVTFLFPGLPLYSQQNRGSIVGTVLDPTQAIITGASVTAHHEETGLETGTISNTTGAYTFPSLNVGTYTLSVSFTGFKTARREKVRVVAGQTVTIDFTLEVGVVAELTTVTAEAPLLDTKTTVLGVTRTVEEIRDLPLQMSGQGRNYLGWILTLPGVNLQPDMKSWAAYDGLSRATIQGAGGGFGISHHSYNLDGVSGVSFANAGLEDAAAPIPEVVEEFRMSTNLNAESGANFGVSFDLVMKSGTNALHGSLFHYLRNDKLDARNFFLAKVAAQKLNHYGFVLGGPLVLPKIYDGRNRTFFFGSFDGFRQRNEPDPAVQSVPTARMQAGDFSELLGSALGTDPLGRPVARGQIYDPLTTRSVGTAFVRDPFPGNVIPTNRFSPISVAFGKFLPLPNRPGTQFNWSGVQTPRHTNHDRIMLKLDHQFSSNHRLTFATDLLPNKFINFEGPYPPQLRFGEIVQQRLYRGRIIYSWIARPNLLFNFRSAFTRGVWDSGLHLCSLGPSSAADCEAARTYGGQAGLKGVLAPYTPFTFIDGIVSYNGSAFGAIYNKFLRIGTHFPANMDLSLTKGTHNLKWGAEFLQQTHTNVLSFVTAGQFFFSERGTGMPGFPGTGAGYASYLLGDVNNASLSTPREAKHATRRWGFYAQDQWRATSKLTINYGLRYDLVEPLREQYRRYGSFDPGVANPAAGGRLGALTFWGNGQGRNGRVALYDIYKRAFGPRLGFAYAINDKTVLRGYYGLLFSALNADFVQGENITGYGWAATVSPTTLDNGVTPAFNWTNGFPPIVPRLPNLDPSHLNGSGVNFFGASTENRPARSQNLGVSVERTLPGEFVVKAAYVGKLIHGVRTSLPLNQLPLQFLTLGNLLLTSIDSPRAREARIPIPYPGFRGSVAQALLPYPQYTGVSQADSTHGFGLYHSFELTAQKRFQRGLTLMLAYTGAKNLANGPFQHLALLNTRKAFFFTDRAQTLSLSYVYELPFGPGKTFLNTSSPLARQLVGGWQIAGIHTYLTGRPVTMATRSSIPGVGGAWANRVPGVPISTGVDCGNYNPGDLNSRFLNINAFATPAPFTFGNTGVLPNFRACGFANENLSIIKSFTLKENLRLRFGAELFNVFNRHHWFGLNADINNPGAFGRYSGATDPRSVQFQLKLEF